MRPGRADAFGGVSADTRRITRRGGSGGNILA